ncbi:50S ribosomal protein L25/general stress protein Ctc [Brackiella oedipodis]|uniref:50S ribosomal protein L25/general stress protein Ctc n=1 Tax=Brackiella oedipodis TaxID=124225 RepID=UPI00048B1A8A|nr:50S ribosomal protein L25/general stress protein Ctc [Brackiella oedipodis]
MKVTATKRSVQGSSASRRLRREGRVPAIVYGGDKEPVNIELDHNEIFHSLRKESFRSSLLDLQIDGESEKVLLRAVQWHAYKPKVLHVDFQRVRAGEEISTVVPLNFFGEEESPAVKEEDASISYVMYEISITCLPRNLPQHIEVDVSGMHDGDVITVADLKAPEGVTFQISEEETVATAAKITEDPSLDEDVDADAEGEEAEESADNDQADDNAEGQE